MGKISTAQIVILHSRNKNHTLCMAAGKFKINLLQREAFGRDQKWYY